MSTSIAYFVVALLLGTFMEYVIHRFYLHSKLRHWVIRRHKLHHKTYVRHSIASEFLGFLPPALPLAWIGFMHGIYSGIAFLVGQLTFVLALAVGHKWSHEAPHRLFWMDPVVHASHHDGDAHFNYGVLTTFWDRIFGTYCPKHDCRQRKRV